MGATWVNTTFKVFDGESAGLVRRCAAMLAEAGAGMAIEFSPLGPVASLQHGLDIVDLSGSDRVGVVVDIWNVSCGPTTWEELEQLPADRIAYVQFNDALPRVGISTWRRWIVGPTRARARSRSTGSRRSSAPPDGTEL